MGGIRKLQGQRPCAFIKLPGPACRRRLGENKLSASDVAQLFRGRDSPKALKKSLEVQLAALRIFGPMDKRGVTAGVIRFP